MTSASQPAATSGAQPLPTTTPWPTQADLGGQTRHIASRVVPEAEGELFHASWEPRVLAMTLAMGATGAWNIDMSRAARETLPAYADLSYYEIWFAALQKLMGERGLLSDSEARTGQAQTPPLPLPRRLAAADVPAALARGSATLRNPQAVQAPARFAPGDWVRARDVQAGHHTRLPRYVAGKRGVIERVHGLHVFADSHAHGLGEQPQWLYTVVFDGAQLWGAQAASATQAAQAASATSAASAAPGLRVSVDAWEPYLEWV